MTEEKNTINPDAETVTPDTKNKKRGGKLPLRKTTAMTVATLIALCSGQSSSHVEANDAIKSPPGTEQIQNSLPSVEDTVNKLKINQDIDQSITLINLASIEQSLDSSDYKGGTGSSFDFHSAPIMEITFDSATQTLKYEDKTSAGLKEQELYNLLAPIVGNAEIILAFKTKRLNKFSIRLQSIDPTGSGKDTYNGQFIISSKTAFMFMPGGRPHFNKLDYETILKHESDHALTSVVTLSESNDTKPTTEDIDDWQNLCINIRNTAVDQAEQYSNNIQTLMEQNAYLFTDSKVNEAFNRISSAISRGDFNLFEPTPGGEINDLSTKVPECRVIGPWESFIRLLSAEGFGDNYEDYLVQSNTRISSLRDNLKFEWHRVIGNYTIYQFFREGTYNHLAGSRDNRIGHSYEDWDELVTSITNIMLNEPEAFIQLTEKLSPEQKEQAWQLIDIVYKTVDSNVPVDQTEFHIKLKTAWALIKKSLSSESSLT